jgi:hypothetical protein
LHPASVAIRRALAAANPDSRSVVMAAAMRAARVLRTEILPNEDLSDRFKRSLKIEHTRGRAEGKPDAARASESERMSSNGAEI